MNASAIETLIICLAVTTGIVFRPGRVPEAVWAAGGAVLLVAAGLLPVREALHGVARGGNVYGFLTGMLLLSEVARKAGLFDWIAAAAVNHAKGSAFRLFTLVYAAGVIVTAFLSNDATAVVMTPAVYAVAKHAKAKPMPLLFCCVIVANAASFVLPISNPANLVFYNGSMPLLAGWLASFGLPALGAILAGFAALRVIFHASLTGASHGAVPQPPLSAAGRAAFIAIAATAVGLTVISALNRPLGLPTLLAGVATAGVVCVWTRTSPWSFLRHVSWNVLPLVAGLFVLVQALQHTGAVTVIADLIHWAAGLSVPGTAAAAGVLLALVCNLTNNLPAGLIAGTAVLQAQPPRMIVDALLIGGDIGPSLSITGSLASLLWLHAIRREGENIGFGAFLRVGMIVMPCMLGAALGARLLLG